MKSERDGKIDGRRLRSERSRLAFVDAVLALQEVDARVTRAAGQAHVEKRGVDVFVPRAVRPKPARLECSSTWQTLKVSW